MSPRQDPAAFLRMLYDAAVDAARPSFGAGQFFDLDPTRPALVLGAGKAAASMAQAFEEAWAGPLRGLVITRRGYNLPTKHIKVLEGDHPTPSEDNIRATTELIELAKTRRTDEQVIFLVSGGGSALLCKPIEGLSLDEKKQTITALMNAGADIREINAVRRQLSSVKGGGIADLLSPAKVTTFAISDVVGDPPLDIASGPTVTDVASPRDALKILSRYGVPLPDTVSALLDRPTRTRAKGVKASATNPYIFISKPMTSLRAAAQAAERCGVGTIIFGDDIVGEARDVGARHAHLALKYASGDNTLKLPCVLLSGGETTVTKVGKGKGGPNTEYLASLFLHLEGHPAISALAADTDGIDGSEDNAGAVITPETWHKARSAGIDAAAYLANNDCYSFFKSLDALLVTGPTFTNVNDFRAVYID
ncbi:glycerate kinase type-2 family protein [Kordiimonas aestuarii]|uniref:glycerate kinase type-2 family protein n=1 Tax=Kordiimonas aestuarii TaxID=1005925 RepID=UPI0021D21E37|nr:glycerate kinase [Kordiimonas aestuarii]